MAKFYYNEIVRTRPDVSTHFRPGERAWIVGVHEESARSGHFLDKYPHGVVYTIEFEDGSSIEIEESMIDKDPEFS